MTSQGPQLPQPHPRSAPSSRMTAVVVFYGALALLGVVIAAANGNADVYRVASRDQGYLVASPLVGVAVGLVVVGGTRLATRHISAFRYLHQGFRDVLGPLSHLEIVVLAASSSIAEEILFRGALLPWLGLGWQAALFGLLHIGPDRRFLLWTALACGMGALLGALTLQLGDIGAATTAHFVVNYLNLRFIAARPLGADQPSARRT